MLVNENPQYIVVQTLKHHIHCIALKNRASITHQESGVISQYIICGTTIWVINTNVFSAIPYNVDIIQYSDYYM